MSIIAGARTATIGSVRPSRHRPLHAESAVHQPHIVWTATPEVPEPEREKRSRKILQRLGKEIYVPDDGHRPRHRRRRAPAALIALPSSRSRDAANFIGESRSLARRSVLQVVSAREASWPPTGTSAS